MKFNIRVKDLELRSCPGHCKAEIVKWANDTDGKEYCWTVAYWEKSKEGYNLRFVGDRPFEVNGRLFMKLAKQGQRLLEGENER